MQTQRFQWHSRFWCEEGRENPTGRALKPSIASKRYTGPREPLSATNASGFPRRNFALGLAVDGCQPRSILEKYAEPSHGVAKTASVAHESRWATNERFVISARSFQHFSGSGTLVAFTHRSNVWARLGTA